MIKISDYIINFLGDKGIDKIFVVYGAANGELIDSFTRNTEVDYVSMMHEQAAGFAAEGYYKTKNLPGVAIATSGPGGQNFVTPIGNCYYDSCPVIFITGQVKTEFQRPDEQVRQIGFQETDIVGIVKPITKYAKMVINPDDIRYEVEKAYHLATSGRPGPVLLDIPMDIAKALINPDNLRSFNHDDQNEFDNDKLDIQIDKLIEDIEKSTRPVFLIGGGVRTSEAIQDFIDTAEFLNIPSYPTYNAVDVVTNDLPIYGGRVGTYGGEGRNFGIQNADLLISVGSRLSGRITGGNVKSFSRESKKYMIDIDKTNLEVKWQQLPFDVNIHCDAKVFFKLLKKKIKKKNYSQSEGQKKWLEKCIKWKNEYDPVKNNFFDEDQKFIHPYAFVRKLSEKLSSNHVIVGDCGGNIIVTYHSFKTKKGQRLFTNNGNSPMGFSFAAALGAFFGDQNKEIICIIGDGGMNMNIQELQTIINYKIKIKVIILNNHIYGITKAFQKTNFDGRMEACGPVGYNPPNFIEIAKAYKIPTMTLDKMSDMNKSIDEFLSCKGSVVYDVDCHEYHTYEPRIFGWNTPIEDMYPYLPRKEFRENMTIEPLDGWKEPALPAEDLKDGKKIESFE
jgi:acetolactate synthase-1/2/3 large subunit|tara:strand:- start:78 stop:1931 length:1854 start_codon:yes stop_codon:yes gene_type:complete